MKYIMKVPMDATQWFKNGDHPKDGKATFFSKSEGRDVLCEGNVVRYYRHPAVRGEVVCHRCDFTMHDHGWIDSGGDGRTVCPGDWIATSVFGEYWPIKPDIFSATYMQQEDSVEDCQRDAMNDPGNAPSKTANNKYGEL